MVRLNVIILGGLYCIRKKIFSSNCFRTFCFCKKKWCNVCSDSVIFHKGAFLCFLFATVSKRKCKKIIYMYLQNCKKVVKLKRINQKLCSLGLVIELKIKLNEWNVLKLLLSLKLFLIFMGFKWVWWYSNFVVRRNIFIWFFFLSYTHLFTRTHTLSLFL